MDLDALRIFLKVAELGSITRAGAQLGLSKSRVSRRVNALERELDAHLFHRTTRAVRLTADGEALLPRARRIVREGDEIGALFHTGRGLRGQVRVDLPVKIARRVILPALPELLARHPAIADSVDEVMQQYGLTPQEVAAVDEHREWAATAA